MEVDGFGLDALEPATCAQLWARELDTSGQEVDGSNLDALESWRIR